MKICVDSSQQRIAVGTALLTLGVCIAGYRHDLDMPHSHSEAPTIPIDFSAISVPASNIANPILYSVSVEAPERNK